MSAAGRPMTDELVPLATGGIGTVLQAVPLTVADVGRTLPCGCRVIRMSIACGWLEDVADGRGHPYPVASCPACVIGVPAVTHAEDTCEVLA